MFPMHSAEKRAKVTGRSGWKVWTPEALLRAAFASPSAATRQVAKEIDGASAGHVLNARMLVADIILQQQVEGLQHQKTAAVRSALVASAPKFWILNLMFDETELELTLDGEGAAW